MKTYKIIRLYESGKAAEVIKKGLTKEEAKKHCTDDDTSSETCYSTEALERTRAFGRWFDAWEEE